MTNQPNQAKAKWKVTTTDKSDGSVMDTARPAQAPYANRQIGPQSKTNFGKDEEKAS
jgi:hypothetical protein